MKRSQNRLKSGRDGGLKKSWESVPNFCRNDNTKHVKAWNLRVAKPERLKARKKFGSYRKFYCFGLSLRYSKGVQILLLVPFW